MMWDPIVPPETPWWSRLGIALLGAVGALFMMAAGDRVDGYPSRPGYRARGLAPGARTALLLVGLALPAAAQIPHPEPFAWEPDLATATERAQETGKPIAAYFTFDT